MNKALIAAAVALAAASLSACETATPYQPLNPAAASAGGYSETQLEHDRWRVTFHGNDMTARETVETYLLYRAAELTVNQGYDWFEAVQRDTERHENTYAEPIGPYGYGIGWRPYWRYWGRGFGWRGWDPYWGDPFWADEVDIHTVERYETSAEIIMHHGPKPTDDRRAFDAREVLSNLASKIVKPK
jgi:hypothetical protein